MAIDPTADLAAALARAEAAEARLQPLYDSLDARNAIINHHLPRMKLHIDALIAAGDRLAGLVESEWGSGLPEIADWDAATEGQA